MEVMLFIAGSLATWRVSKIITEEEGPFEIFKKLRASFPSDGKRGWIGRGLYCLWCVSVWVGLVVGQVVGLVSTPVLQGVVYGLGFSTMAIVIDYAVEYIGRQVRK